MTPDAYAIVVLPGGSPRIWPTAGRNQESFEARCATGGATVIRVFASLEDAVSALCLPIDGRFTGR